MSVSVSLAGSQVKVTSSRTTLLVDAVPDAGVSAGHRRPRVQPTGHPCR